MSDKPEIRVILAAGESLTSALVRLFEKECVDVVIADADLEGQHPLPAPRPFVDEIILRRAIDPTQTVLFEDKPRPSHPNSPRASWRRNR